MEDDITVTAVRAPPKTHRHERRKAGTGKVHQLQQRLQKLNANKAWMEKLSDKRKAREADKEKDRKWQAVIKKANGERIIDDPAIIKKRLNNILSKRAHRKKHAGRGNDPQSRRKRKHNLDRAVKRKAKQEKKQE
eukprot:Protomagalhaensia_sp_Gyna_25__1704@NODE_1890_length_1443_cov_15_051282_g1554_i0_p2_GENE_NODE_1890_length_1443_cov_15_051282_g1554_i0NODE_1890_length_1443_cov_15_051282_g1554_i0_p2_ORF_typecomplete_len135_score30_46SURF6/PF04935_12/2_2e05T2SSM/PF04612_12/7_5_NODE_1890_length_1443_cov_15_051282_g1554_i042446